MTLEEKKLDNTENYEKILDEKEPSLASTSSGNKSTLKLQQNEIQRINESPEIKGTSAKIDEDQNQFFSYKDGTPIIRSPSVYDNRSETNTNSLPRSQSGVLSAVIRPTKPLLGPKSNSMGDLHNFPRLRKAQTAKNKNENMMLQLIVPSPNQDIPSEANNTYLSVRSVDDILGNGHLKERHMRPHSVNGPQDFYLSPPNGGFINRAYSSSDLTEYGHPGGSQIGFSVPVTPVPITDEERPTSPEEKKRAFTGLLTKVLSVFYALFNITLGLASYVADIIDGTQQIAEVFSLLLVSMAFLYILYLTIDIHIHMKKKRQYEKLLDRNTPERIDMKETAEGHFQFNIPLPQAVTLKRPLEHHYCFKKDRHSTNFYLKIGAAGFCFGHLIHSGLIIGYQMVFLTTDPETFYECTSVATLVLDFLYPIYSFLLLFFMFKYSNVIINKHRILARFGVMHCLSSSICFWVWTIFRETMEILAYYRRNNATEPYIYTNSVPFSSNLTEYNDASASADYIDISPRRFTAVCEHDDETLSAIYRNYAPYLFPFSVEFSILVVGVLYLVWQNIGVCKQEEEEETVNEEDQTRQCKSPSGNGNNTESNIVVHADCHSSSKGLFGGFIVLVITVISTILFFIAIYTNDGEHGQMGVTVNVITSVIILTCMTLACLLAYRQITKLDINTAHHNLLDDILLFICIPAYFLNGIFSIIPSIMFGNVLGSINVCLEVVQVLLQTSFIIDGVRRSSNTKELRKKKPGRELVTFLTISNVALWIFQTFEVKMHGMQDDRYDFYGKELWTILGHMCLPLMMFYRFHASVCIGDIWKYAYEPPGH